MNELESYREQMSKLDEQLVQLFLERMQLSKEIGIYKKKNHLPIFQAEREKLVLEKVTAMTTNSQEKKCIETLFQMIMNLSKEVQE